MQTKQFRNNKKPIFEKENQKIPQQKPDKKKQVKAPQVGVNTANTTGQSYENALFKYRTHSLNDS